MGHPWGKCGTPTAREKQRDHQQRIGEATRFYNRGNESFIDFFGKVFPPFLFKNVNGSRPHSQNIVERRIHSRMPPTQEMSATSDNAWSEGKLECRSTPPFYVKPNLTLVGTCSTPPLKSNQRYLLHAHHPQPKRSSQKRQVLRAL